MTLLNRYQLLDTVQLEEGDDGRCTVYVCDTPERPQWRSRIGLVIGGNRHWSAEASRNTLGVYPTRREAIEALVDHALDQSVSRLIPAWAKMRDVAAQLEHPRPATEIDFRIDRDRLIEFKDIPSRWIWNIRPNGTHLFNLDLQWERRETRSVFRVFKDGVGRGVHFILVDTGKNTAQEVSPDAVARLLNTSPRIHLDGNALKVGNKTVALFREEEVSSPGSGRKTVVSAELVPGADPRLDVLLTPAKQFYEARLENAAAPSDGPTDMEEDAPQEHSAPAAGPTP
jgi:hypothetical protein